MTKTADHHLKLFSAADEPDTIDAALETVAQIAFDPIAELEKTHRALRRAQAELAAGAAVVAPPRPQRHLAERLESVLKASAEAIGCRAAGLYLLDDATTELQLRCSWNLPPERLREPARPLAGAAADLEALAGHAVALEDTTDYGRWNLPETCGAAVCVPVASPTTPLGTLWVFSNGPRPFSDHEVNLVEIAAGRIASDLERESLLTDTHEAVQLRRDRDVAAERRRSRVPRVAPLCDRWEIAARADDVGRVLHDFYDWLSAGDGALCAALGSVEAADFSGALEIESLRSAWRAHSRHSQDCGHWLEWINDDLWRGSTAAVAAHLLALRAAGNGTLALAGAGRPGAALVGVDGARMVLSASPALLGRDADFRGTPITVSPAPGEYVLLADDAARLERIVGSWNAGLPIDPPRSSAARVLDLLLAHAPPLHRDAPHGTYLLLRRRS